MKLSKEREQFCSEIEVFNQLLGDDYRKRVLCPRKSTVGKIQIKVRLRHIDVEPLRDASGPATEMEAGMGRSMIGDQGCAKTGDEAEEIETEQAKGAVTEEEGKRGAREAQGGMGGWAAAGHLSVQVNRG